MYRRYWITLVFLAILSPLGLLANGTAWGEWGAQEMQETLGYVPQGMGRLGELWQAFFPDYSMPFLGEGTVGEYAGYIFSAIIGSVIVYALVLVITKLLLTQKMNRSA